MNILWHMPTLQTSCCGLSLRAVQLAEQLSLAGHRVQFLVDSEKTDLRLNAAGPELIRVRSIASKPIHWALQQFHRSAGARHVARQITQSHDLFISCQPETISAYTRLHPDRDAIFVCGGTTLLHDEAQKNDQARLPAWRRIPFAMDRLLRRRAESAGFHSASAVIFDSYHTRDLVSRKYCLNSNRTFAIHGSVDADYFVPATQKQRIDARGSLGIGPDRQVLLWTGRIAPEKNVELLIDAIAESANSRVMCVLVGDGPHRSNVQARVESLGLSDRVIFAGRQPDVRPYLHAADVFVFPSRGESFGCSLAEAMACGLACVALKSDGDGVQNASSELITSGCSGVLVEEPDPRTLWAAIAALLESDSKREAIGFQARRRAASCFTWQTAGQQLVRVIQAVVSGSNETHPATVPSSQFKTLPAGIQG
jgi:glycosyltransferase involved in cell wall biosynthesis